MKPSLVRRSLGAAMPLALALALSTGLLSQSAAVPEKVQAIAATAKVQPGHAGTPPLAQNATTEREHVATGGMKASQLPPLAASKDALKEEYGEDTKPPVPSPKSAEKALGKTAGGKSAAACSTSDFTSRTGSALVQQIKASTPDCVNTLFNLTGNDAYYAFREAQMSTVAYAVRDGSASYPGNSSTGMPQLLLYLRAGYYVHYYNEATVGSYGSTLQTAIRSGLDGFFASAHSRDVNDANGEALAEAVTLIDSAEENARYIYVVKRMLADYDSSWNSSWWMLNAVNNVYTVTFRGHQVPAVRDRGSVRSQLGRRAVQLHERPHSPARDGPVLPDVQRRTGTGQVSATLRTAVESSAAGPRSAERQLDQGRHRTALGRCGRDDGLLRQSQLHHLRHLQPAVAAGQGCPARDLSVQL